MSFEDLRTDNPLIDTEHKNLHRMLSSLQAVIAAGRDMDVILEAFMVMKERMRLHCEAEEDYARRIDPRACETLRAEHKRLMAEIDELRTHLTEPSVDRQAAVEHFLTSLERHDQQIDVPIFKRLNGTA